MKRKLDGNDVPMTEVPGAESKDVNPSFDSFGLDPRLLQALAREQYAAPRPVQTQVIPVALQGKDILAKSKTGTGKTAAYVLPCLQSILQSKSGITKLAGTSVLVLVPSHLLSDQVSQVFIRLSQFCGKDVRCLNLAQDISDAVLSSKLNEKPDILVSTPGKVAKLLATAKLSISDVRKVVIDEADTILSYHYDRDLDTISRALPSGIQTFLVSATLTPDVEKLAADFLHDPVSIDIESKEEASHLEQYLIQTTEDDKFLLLFVIFKLKLLEGKTIIFVADVDRSYKVKLYLEQYGIRACILNSELPLNSRLHVVQEFNKGLYDTLIAADDQEVIGGIQRRNKKVLLEDEDDVDRSDDDAGAGRVKPGKDFGVSRGIDFQNVATILNFDFPNTSKSYTHRIGRTARAETAGTALSFYIPRSAHGTSSFRHNSLPSSRYDEKVLEKIRARQASKGQELKDFTFDLKQLEGFRYRHNDALRAVSQNAIRDARSREIKQELIKSDRLQKHFEENPADLQALRHDGRSGTLKVQAHMKHIPTYLLPGKATKPTAESIGLVRFNKDKGQKKRRFGHKGRLGKRGGKVDPLKSFKSRKQKRTEQQ